LLVFFSEPPPTHGVGEFLQQRHRFFPADASIRDALAVDEFLAWQEILTSTFQMAFDQDTNDPTVTAGNLSGDIPPHFDLAEVVFLAIRVTQIDHDSLGKARSRRF